MVDASPAETTAASGKYAYPGRKTCRCYVSNRGASERQRAAIARTNRRTLPSTRCSYTPTTWLAGENPDIAVCRPKGAAETSFSGSVPITCPDNRVRGAFQTRRLRRFQDSSARISPWTILLRERKIRNVTELTRRTHGRGVKHPDIKRVRSHFIKEKANRKEHVRPRL